MAELDAAVGPAAQALLDAPELRITAVYFGIEDSEQATGFDWLEYRMEGDFLVVFNQREPRHVEAFIQIDGELYSATTTAQGGEPWSAAGSQLGNPSELLGLLEILTQNASQPSRLIGETGSGSQVTSQQDSEGNSLWTFRQNSSDPDVIELAAQWLLNRDGILHLYRVGSDVEPISGFGGIVYEFGLADDLERLERPALGTPLDLEDLGVPEGLIDLGE